jgi:hypothetical protein
MSKFPFPRQSAGRHVPPFGPEAVYLALLAALNRRKRKPGRDKEEGGVPAEPDRPRDLTGGAAVPLDFDEDSN